MLTWNPKQPFNKWLFQLDDGPNVYIENESPLKYPLRNLWGHPHLQTVFFCRNQLRNGWSGAGVFVERTYFCREFIFGTFTPDFCRDDDFLKMTPLEFLHLTFVEKILGLASLRVPHHHTNLYEVYVPTALVEIFFFFAEVFCRGVYLHGGGGRNMCFVESSRGWEQVFRRNGGQDH